MDCNLEGMVVEVQDLKLLPLFNSITLSYLSNNIFFRIHKNMLALCSQISKNHSFKPQKTRFLTEMLSFRRIIVTLGTRVTL